MILENINIDIDIAKENLENIDINKAILQNIDIVSIRKGWVKPKLCSNTKIPVFVSGLQEIPPSLNSVGRHVLKLIRVQQCEYSQPHSIFNYLFSEIP